jgi:hypothetical protein
MTLVTLGGFVTDEPRARLRADPAALGGASLALCDPPPPFERFRAEEVCLLPLPPR